MFWHALIFVCNVVVSHPSLQTLRILHRKYRGELLTDILVTRTSPSSNSRKEMPPNAADLKNMIEFEIINLFLYAVPELNHRHIHPLLEETVFLPPYQHCTTWRHEIYIENQG